MHLVWSRGGAGPPYALLETRISPAGELSAAKTIVSGWARIDDVAAASNPGGGGALEVVFGGGKTDTTGDPTIGLNAATWGGGEWQVASTAILTSDFADSSVPAVSWARSGPVVLAWSASGTVEVRYQSAQGSPVYRIGTGANVNVVGLPAGSVADQAVVAWCASGPRPGIYVAAVDTAKGGATPRRLPGSETTRCPAATRTALAAETGGGVFAAASVASERTVKVWEHLGEAVTVAGGPGIKQQVALAADRNGRLWVGWRDTDSNRLLLRRSNRKATVWGAVVSTAMPVSQGSLYALDLSAQDDRVDVIERTSTGSAVSLYQTQMWPGLTVEATSKGGRVAVAVTDAGDPVPGTSVLVGTHRLRTNGDGEASIDLPPGSYKVSADKLHYASATGLIRTPG